MTVPLPPEMELTLKVRVRGYGTPLTREELAQLGTILSRDEWSDGRYPFSVELTRHGLNQQLASGLQHLVWEQALAAHPTNSDADVAARQAYCAAREQQLQPLVVGADFAVALHEVEY